MAITRSRPNFEAAASGNHDLHQALRNFHDDLETLKKKTGGVAFNPDKQEPLNTPPPQAAIAISGANGRYTVRLTNPQVALPVRNSAVVRNQLRTPIEHILRASLNPAFDADGDVRDFGPSTQTYWLIEELGPGTRWFRLKSSFDGVNYNQELQTGPFTA